MTYGMEPKNENTDKKGELPSRYWVKHNFTLVELMENEEAIKERFQKQLEEVFKTIKSQLLRDNY